MLISGSWFIQYPVLILLCSETIDNDVTEEVLLQHMNLQNFRGINLTARCLFQYDSRNTKKGNFSSPHFPSPYSENVECFYNFIGQPFETLTLTFQIFDLEPPYVKGCLTDYIDISTITASNVKQLVGRYCGTEVLTPLLSMHPRAEIIFRTNHIVHHQGFHGTYEFTDEKQIPPAKSTPHVSGCGGTEGGVGGVIISPGYPQSFPKDVECVWLIRVDNSKHIYIRILELQLYGSIANCADAELSIYDGYSSFNFNPEIMKKYCGDLKYYKNVEERTQMSKRNRLLIRFRTSVTSEAKGQSLDKIIGFKLVWTAVSFQVQGECTQHVCKNSHYCLNTPSTSCVKMPQFCVHKSLVCNGLPNCSEDDYTDEDKCNLPLLAGCGGALCVLVLCLCIGMSLYRRHNRVRKSLSQTQALTMQLRQLEHSPSFVSRQMGNYYSQPGDLRSPIDHINCSIHSGIHSHLDNMHAPRYTSYPTDV